eukprot:13127515-Alexandrium_andersonii.AAC.1
MDRERPLPPDQRCLLASPDLPEHNSPKLEGTASRRVVRETTHALSELLDSSPRSPPHARACARPWRPPMHSSRGESGVGGCSC